MSNPLYQSSSWGFKVAVFEDRIESKFLGQMKVIPLSSISSVTKEPLDLRAYLILNSGEKTSLNPKDTKEFIRIVSELLNKKATTKTTNSNLDELDKLATLKEKGVVTQEEFESKKKQLLGI